MVTTPGLYTAWHTQYTRQPYNHFDHVLCVYMWLGMFFHYFLVFLYGTIKLPMHIVNNQWILLTITSSIMMMCVTDRTQRCHYLASLPISLSFYLQSCLVTSVNYTTFVALASVTTVNHIFQNNYRLIFFNYSLLVLAYLIHRYYILVFKVTFW